MQYHMQQSYNVPPLDVVCYLASSVLALIPAEQSHLSRVHCYLCTIVQAGLS